MSNVIWKKTDKHVYATIYREHCKELFVFSSFSDPSGWSPIGNGRPRMITEWGFKDSDFPLIKSIGTKKDEDQSEYDYQYFIAVILENDNA